MEKRTLVLEAIAAKEAAYVPYSGFRVGAALLSKSGRIYRGCNVENAAYTPTNCAERTAFFKAVSEGEKEFLAIAITGDTDDYVYPCGVCRQVMAEFCDPEAFRIILAKNEDAYCSFSLGELLPGGFTAEDLKKVKKETK
ncbi:MAG: cytidine deaminase [Roseburia sp.]